jgi:hypothetical protein
MTGQRRSYTLRTETIYKHGEQQRSCMQIIGIALNNTV